MCKTHEVLVAVNCMMVALLGVSHMAEWVMTWKWRLRPELEMPGASFSTLARQEALRHLCGGVGF